MIYITKGPELATASIQQHLFSTMTNLSCSDVKNDCGGLNGLE
jgi:hypothetical protein